MLDSRTIKCLEDIMSRVTHFEISANDPNSLISFYRSVFNWEIKKWDGPFDYWLVTTGEEGTPGINGAFFRPKEELCGTINTIEVRDLDEKVAKVLKNGGKTVTEKMTIPGVGYQIYCKDLEGTIFGLYQNDPGAVL